MTVKVAKYTFEKLDVKDYWVNFCGFGNCTSSEVLTYNDIMSVPMLFEKEVPYQLGFDQSTSNTGLFVKDYENNVAFMLEFHRKAKEDPTTYAFQLEIFLHRQFEGCTLTHMIYEKPIDSGSYRSSQVLFQLEGMMLMLSKRYPEFQNARIDSIVNASWRRVIINPEYEHYGRKQASRYSIVECFPWTGEYGNSLGTDQDVFEAIGVMFGWFLNSFDELGRPYVRGDKFTGTIGGFVLPGIGAEEVARQFTQAGLDSYYRVENPRKSIYENLASATAKYKIVCVELRSKSAMLALSIECGLKWLDPDVMTVVLVAANHVDRRLFQITGEEYHFVV